MEPRFQEVTNIVFGWEEDDLKQDTKNRDEKKKLDHYLEKAQVSHGASFPITTRKV